MTGRLDLVVALALLASAFIQGLSGVGFSLIAAPVITQAMPGASAIGLINLLALSQNSFMIWREGGRIRWAIIRRLLPGLGVGVVVGLVLSAALSDEMRPLVVAASSLASLGALLLWKPKASRRSAAIAASWSGAVNSYASVGGPPLASYLVHLDLEQSEYVRTQQVCFALLNIVSIPFLGLPSITLGWLGTAIAVIVIGTILGRWTRRFYAPSQARQLTMVVIGLVAVAALVRSMVSLLT